MSFSASVQALVEQAKSPLVGRAPSWERVALSEIATILNGYPWKSIHFNASRGVPVIRIRDVTSGATDTLYDGEIVEDYWVEDGDLLVGMDGDFNCRVWAGGRALLNQRVCRITLNTGLYSASLLARVLPGYLSLINDQTHSVTVKHLSSKTLADFPLPLPPLAEQRRIVAKIDSLSSKSKRAREHLDHIPRLVEKYKQAVLAAAFRGELTRAYRVNRPDASNCNDLSTQIIRERNEMRAERGIRSKGKNRSLPPKVANAVNLPSGWSWLTFDDCSWDMTVGHVGPMKDRYVDEGVVFLRSLNVRANRINLQKAVYIDEAFDRELGKSRLHPGDLVVVRTGEPGVAAVIPEQLSKANCSDLVICRLVGHLNPNYAAYYMNSEFAKALVRATQVGVAQQHFNVGAMSEMPVPVPSLGEQNEIVRRIEGAFTWIDRLAAEATSARKLIDRLDQAVLAKAFRGELVPQDPNDEPASVLLERIRVERETAPAAKPRRGRAGRS